MLCGGDCGEGSLLPALRMAQRWWRLVLLNSLKDVVELACELMPIVPSTEVQRPTIRLTACQLRQPTLQPHHGPCKAIAQSQGVHRKNGQQDDRGEEDRPTMAPKVVKMDVQGAPWSHQDSPS